LLTNVDVISLDVYGGNVDVNNGGNHAPTAGLGSNDGQWAQDCITWISSLGSLFVYAVWSPWEPADDLLAPGTNPAEQAVWKNMWGTTHFQRSLGNWYQGSSTPSEP
jgi:hypothetical protein